MIKKVLEQIERDLDAYVDHAADCKIAYERLSFSFRKSFNAGAFEAYRQAAVRSAKIVFTYWKPAAHVLKYNDIGYFVDTMIQDRMEVKREKLKKV